MDLLVTGITLSSLFICLWRCFGGPTGSWDHTEWLCFFAGIFSVAPGIWGKTKAELDHGRPSRWPLWQRQGSPRSSHGIRVVIFAKPQGHVES